MKLQMILVPRHMNLLHTFVSMVERHLVFNYGGGLFHIDTIEVHPVLRGRDMGLLLIRKALKFLGSRWTLAVMMPIDTMFIYGTKWNTNAKNLQAVNWEELTEKKLQLQTKENHSLKVKLLRYFGRMGFTQAQKTTNGYNKLFLTSEMYYTFKWYGQVLGEEGRCTGAN